MKSLIGSEPSNSAVVRLENVSVRYRVPHERVGTFKEYAIRTLQRQINHDEFWALQDVSLEVRPGEVFGIIGQNGAGKSTLLKVIARVLRPTMGRVRVRGRVAPLLELGAGFHPELTGIENVFLNAAILGLSQTDTMRRLDAIVDFAELRDFIDAPLRVYSSGMVARLGFAVATAVEPNILIVDEVLSVGDERFARKCMARIGEFRRQGATILMVSHSKEAILRQCERALWLEQGKALACGNADEVVSTYQSFLDSDGRIDRGRRYFHPTWGITRAELVRALVVALDLPLCQPEQPSFGDVGPESRDYPYIETARASGAVAGYDDGSFQPDKTVTRAEAVTIAVRLGSYPKEQARSRLVDVFSDQWYAEYVETAFAHGLLDFVHGDRFEPARELSRAEAAVLGVKLAGFALVSPDVPTFADVPREFWGFKYIETAWERDLFGRKAKQPVEAIEPTLGA